MDFACFRRTCKIAFSLPCQANTQKDTDIAVREKSLREREQAVARAKEAIDDQVPEKLVQERAKIVADEARKAKLALATSKRFSNCERTSWWKPRRPGPI